MEQELWVKWNPKEYLEEYHAEVAVDAKKVIESKNKLALPNTPNCHKSLN